MSMKYYEREEKCVFCHRLVKRYKICEQCIIDMLYEAYAKDEKPAKNVLTLAYRRGLKPCEIREEVREDAKGRIR